MARLALLFTVVPLLETYLLVVLGGLLGFWPTVGIVLLTGVVGAWLAKSEGLRVLRRWQEALAGGRVPEEGVLGGLLVLVGGVLLVTPGVLTDVVGLSLLFPPTRRRVAGWAKRWAERRIERGQVRVVSMGPTVRPMQVVHGPPLRRPVGRRVRAGVIDVEGEVLEVDGRPVGD